MGDARDYTEIAASYPNESIDFIGDGLSNIVLSTLSCSIWKSTFD